MNNKALFVGSTIVLLCIASFLLLQKEKKIEDVNDFYSIKAVYPNESLDKNNTMRDIVMQKINEKKEAWKIGGDLYTQEQKIAKDFPDRPKMQYQYDISYKKYESLLYGTVSYVFTTYEFTGGANGNIAIDTFTFNKEGKVDVESVLNLATDNNDIKLSRILADTAMADTQAGYNKDMLYEGLGLAYLKADGKTLDVAKCHCDGFFFGSNFQHFIIIDEGIGFVFSKYQIAPGVLGTPEVMLPWEVVQDYTLGSFKGK